VLERACLAGFCTTVYAVLLECRREITKLALAAKYKTSINEMFNIRNYNIKHPCGCMALAAYSPPRNFIRFNSPAGFGWYFGFTNRSNFRREIR
jgi:hypothetical protein